MKTGPQIQVKCIDCEHKVPIDVLTTLAQEKLVVLCPGCEKKYAFSEPLLKQMQIFQKLCSQIQEAKDLLGDMSIEVKVGSEAVLVPYKLLLTRFNSVFQLHLPNQDATLEVLIEPTLEKVN